MRIEFEIINKKNKKIDSKSLKTWKELKYYNKSKWWELAGKETFNLFVYDDDDELVFNRHFFSWNDLELFVLKAEIKEEKEKNENNICNRSS